MAWQSGRSTAVLAFAVVAALGAASAAGDAPGINPARGQWMGATPGVIDLPTALPTGSALDRTGVADTSPSWIAAIDAANRDFAAGRPNCIRVPAGVFRVDHPLPTFTGPGCIVGEGPVATFVKTAPTLAGPLFSWSDAWVGRDVDVAYPFGGATMGIAAQRAGPTVRSLTIVGDRRSRPQTALMFYDHEDFASIEDVNVFHMNGSALATGVVEHARDAYLRESHILNFRVFNSGSATAPAVDFGSANARLGTNDIVMIGIDIYAPYGTGMRIGSGAAGFYGEAIRIEGLEGNPAGVRGDLLQVGDPGATVATTGEVEGIHLRGLNLIDPYAGSAALHVAGADSDGVYDLDFEGSIGGGAPRGRGLQVDVGRSSSFRFAQIHTDDTNLTIGSAVGPHLVIDGRGNEGTWSTRDDSPPHTVQRPMLTWARDDREASPQTRPGTSENGATADPAVERLRPDPLPTSASAPPESPGSDASPAAPCGGRTGRCSDGRRRPAGGSRGSAAAPGHTGRVADAGSTHQQERPASGAVAFGSDNRAGNGARTAATIDGGTAQTGQSSMSVTVEGTAVHRLLASAAGGAPPCAPPSGQGSLAIRMDLVARDVDGSSTLVWSLPAAALSRTGGPDTTVLTQGTPVQASTGAGSGASVRAAADPGDGCLSIAFTPPPGNGHRWHVGATVTSIVTP